MSILSRIWRKIEDLFERSQIRRPPYRPPEGPTDRPPHPLDYVSAMEVAAALTRKARQLGGDLDPLLSVVDLLKVLDEPSDLNARTELAGEFHSGRKFTGSAADNEWLIAELLQRLGEPQNRWRLEKLDEK